MRNGRFILEKKEYLIEKFTTKEGLFEFFTVTALWYFLIVKFIEEWYGIIYPKWFGLIPIAIVAEYVTYLSLSIIFNLIGFILAVGLVKVYHIIRRNI